MIRVDLGETRFRGRVVDVVAGTVGMRGPVLAGVVEAVPDFDLDDDAPLVGLAQERREATPIFRIPLIQIVLAIGSLVIRIEFKIMVVPVAHGVADVVDAHRLQGVEMRFQTG